MHTKKYIRMEKENKLPEPFNTALKRKATIDYTVQCESDGVPDHNYVRSLGYRIVSNSDTTSEAVGLIGITLSGYGNWGTLFPVLSNDDSIKVFIDMYKKGIIQLWRIRDFVDGKNYNYSVGDRWTVFDTDTRKHVECDCPYNFEKQ